MTQETWYTHCVNGVPIWNFFWSVFFRIWTEYFVILRISPYSVRMRENADQKNSEYGHFLRSVPDAHFGPYQTSIMKYFAKAVNYFKCQLILQKSFIIDV